MNHTLKKWLYILAITIAIVHMTYLVLSRKAPDTVSPTPKPSISPSSSVGIQRYPKQSRILIQNVEFSISVEAIPQEPQTGHLTHFIISVEKDGTPVDLLAIGRIMQVSLMSFNTVDFEHFLLVTPNEEGLYTFDYVLTQPDEYVMWIDVDHNNQVNHHGDNTDFRSITYLSATGATVDGYNQISEPIWESTVDGYTFNVEPTVMRTDDITTLSITGTNPEGKPVTFVLNDPFYVLASPASGNYDLEHMHAYFSSQDVLYTQEVAFLEPGKYLFWAFVYVEEADGRIRVLNPRFLFDVQKNPEKYLPSLIE